MIAKGHDFSDVELGIVIDADLGLVSHEVNAVEKLSQLLIQVTGRVGRSGKSKIIVQSNLLDNEYLNILSSGDYLEFSKHLLKEYEAANLPPFSSVAILRASSPNKTSNINFLNKARKYLEKETNCECIGPLPDIISKVRGNFRYSLLLKAKTLPTLHKNAKNLVEGYIEKQKRLKVRWSLDFNPIDYQ
jgi:Primosomal protein N'' (replication factor Y) - superfamily II helicase